MNIYPISVLTTNYVYVIAKDNVCILVDPGEAKPVLDFLENRTLSPKAILLTHKHLDHVGGVKGILDLYDIPVYGGRDEEFSFDVIGLGESINLLGIEIQVLALPGHTLGGVGYLIGEHLFTGDVLFSAGCGYIFEGSAEQMVDSLDKIRALGEVKIYPGHDYVKRNLAYARYVEPENEAIDKRIKLVAKETVPSTLSLEMSTNPFLRLDEPDMIERVNMLSSREISSRVDRFAFLRQFKSGFDKRG